VPVLIGMPRLKLIESNLKETFLLIDRGSGGVVALFPLNSFFLLNYVTVFEAFYSVVILIVVLRRGIFAYSGSCSKF